MSPVLRIAICVLMAGVLLAPAAESQGVRDAPAELAELLETDGLTREQFGGLYRSLALAQFQPPACLAGQERFTDVPATSPFCPWIEELARRGVTGGCTAIEYCPGSPVTRAQMAVFVVKAMEACPTLDPSDEMIRVGGVCVDKYEASIWDAPVGGNQIAGAIPCAANGQDCDNIFARSVVGVAPTRFITWFQAQAALTNSGKRLPTSTEWQIAAQGTPDDTGPGTTPCNTRSAGVQNTGSNVGCVSDWGAFDMVGNLFEWVADWVPRSTTCPHWGSFSDDFMCLSGASDSVTAPGAFIRGGNFSTGAGAGPFAVSGLEVPSSVGSSIGFRGAR